MKRISHSDQDEIIRLGNIAKHSLEDLLMFAGAGQNDMIVRRMKDLKINVEDLGSEIYALLIEDLEPEVKDIDIDYEYPTEYCNFEPFDGEIDITND